MKLVGIGASPGVSFAKVFKIKEVNIEIKETKANVQEEQAKIDKAIKDTINQIKKVKEVAIKNLGAEEVAILDAHIQIASDPAMIAEIQNMIQTTKVNAAFATDKITQKYIAMFESMEDEYMQERAADIKDVSTKIIYSLLQIPLADISSIQEQVIIVANDLTPSDTAQLNKDFVKGFVTNIGGKTSHAAIMARSLEIPAILGLGNITKQVKSGDMLAINGNTGVIVINPSSKQIQEFQKLSEKIQLEKKAAAKFKGLKSQTQDGFQLKIASNIGKPHDVLGAIDNDAEAIGLFRSEFLYMDASNWPTEEEQLQAYQKVLQDMGNKQVVIRTLDIGGDKKLSYYQFPKETNPFLGYRAIRLCLDKQDIFITQLRALIRASVFGNLAIMFPMIATIEEFLQAKQIFEDTYAKLVKEKMDIAPRHKIELGMMVEIPAVAAISKQFAKYVDFFSIGTNDLMQYTMAANRMSEKVAYLYQPLNPSILQLIKMTIDGAHSKGKWVGMCGEMAGDTNVIPLLVGMGIDELSMSATSILQTRKQIANINQKAATQLVAKALELDSEKEVQELVNKFNV